MELRLGGSYVVQRAALRPYLKKQPITEKMIKTGLLGSDPPEDVSGQSQASVRRPEGPIIAVNTALFHCSSCHCC